MHEQQRSDRFRRNRHQVRRWYVGEGDVHRLPGHAIVLDQLIALQSFLLQRGEVRFAGLPLVASYQRKIIEARRAESAVWPEGIVWNRADELPTHSDIESLGVSTRRVEHEQRLATFARDSLGLVHQRFAHAPSPGSAMYE